MRGVNVVGSANMDLVVRAARLPKPGETLLGVQFQTQPGGKGANQAAAIGMIGGFPLLVACVGKDAFGQSLCEALQAANVDISAVERDPESPTGVAMITVDAHGENTIIVAPGANSKLNPERVHSILRSNPAHVMLAQLEVPIDALIAAAGAHDGLLILNPAPACALPLELLQRVDVLTPNESECHALVGILPADSDSTYAAGKKLLDLGVHQVVLTLGARGAALIDERGLREFAAPRVEVLDTTAAGDAFGGTLAHFLSLDYAIDDSVRMAVAAASISVTRRGAMGSMPSKRDLEAFYPS